MVQFERTCRPKQNVDVLCPNPIYSRATDVNSRIIQLENELTTTETTAEGKKMVLQDFLIVRSVHPTSYKRQIEKTGGRESSPDHTRSTSKVPFWKRSCQYDLYPPGPSMLNFYSSEKVI
uniref:Uncharacterized protein n=1 Tax=Caenorhabditis japonica TaxID=281687 RepID=A0A8R1IQM8_CAEJA